MLHNYLILLTLFRVSSCVETCDRLKNYRPGGCHRSAYQERKYTVKNNYHDKDRHAIPKNFLLKKVQLSTVAGGHHEN